MPPIPAEPKLERGAPRERDQGNSGEREDDAHRGVGQAFGVDGPGGEVKLAVEAGEEAGEADEHFGERRVDVKVERLIYTTKGIKFRPMWYLTSRDGVDVLVGSEFAKVRFVPYDRVGSTDAV